MNIFFSFKKGTTLVLNLTTIVLLLLISNRSSIFIEAFRSSSRTSGWNYHPAASVILSTSSSVSSNDFFSRGGGFTEPTTLTATTKTRTTGSSSLKMITFDNTPLIQSSAIIVATNGLGLLLNILTPSHYHVDLLGTGAFALSVIPQLINSSSDSNFRVTLSASFVAIWSIKLAGFLFYRVIKNKHDGRLDGTLSTVSGAVGFWIVSALWGILCALPHYLGATSNSEGNVTCLGIGSAMYVIGLITETLADYQKWKFKKSNPKQFCNVGLWSKSQHPNWFGNLVLWAGIFVMNAPAMIEPVASPGASLITQILCYKRVFFSLLSPLFMTWLFQGEADGTITNALELSKKRYGDDPNFKRYIQNVPLIVPKLF